MRAKGEKLQGVKRGRCVMWGGRTLAGAKEEDAVVSENAIGGDLSMFLACTVGGVGSNHNAVSTFVVPGFH